MLLWTQGCMHLFKLEFYLDNMPRSWISGSYGNSISSFLGSSILFFIEAIPIYVSTNSGGGFPFLHTLFSIICRLSDGGNSDCCEVIHQGIFDCISWVVTNAEHLLMCLLTTCTYIICIKGKWPFFYKGRKIFSSGLTFVF